MRCDETATGQTENIACWSVIKVWRDERFGRLLGVTGEIRERGLRDVWGEGGGFERSSHLFLHHKKYEFGIETADSGPKCLGGKKVKNSTEGEKKQ